MSYEIIIGEAVQIDPLEYKKIYFISVDINDHPTGILVGKKGTELNIDVLTCGDVFNYINSDIDYLNLIREKIKECDEKEALG